MLGDLAAHRARKAEQAELDKAKAGKLAGRVALVRRLVLFPLVLLAVFIVWLAGFYTGELS